MNTCKFLLILFVLQIISCSEVYEEQKIKTIVNIESLRQIPYAMNRLNIDTVFEIVTQGEMDTLEKGDTIGFFNKKGNKVVNHYYGAWGSTVMFFRFNQGGLDSTFYYSSMNDSTFVNWEFISNKVIRFTSHKLYHDSLMYVFENDQLVRKSSVKKNKQFISSEYSYNAN